MKNLNYLIWIAAIYFLNIGNASYMLAQIRGKIISTENKPIANASIIVNDKQFSSNKLGEFVIDSKFTLPIHLQITHTEFKPKKLLIDTIKNDLIIVLEELNYQNTETIVISGMLKETTIENSPIKIETYTASFLNKNPSSNLFEAIGLINGIRPQINCNVCGTGDIHINGMEGPYTMVAIDGMPIMSGLASVYGFMGIPGSLIDRIEVIKGPASTLFGTEAVGGLINIITKTANKVPFITCDINLSGYQEYNANFLTKIKSRNWSTIISGDIFDFSKRIDINNDNFTDIPLQKRYAGFVRLEQNGTKHITNSIALRLVSENRFGGQLNFRPEMRGNDSIYGEWINTFRVEAIGTTKINIFKENININYSFSNHHQDSWYGSIRYQGKQFIGFANLFYNTNVGERNELLVGISNRYTYYNDNTPGTMRVDSIDSPEKTWLPGIFFQDQIRLTEKIDVLAGLRVDHHPIHRRIYSPRIALKSKINATGNVRVSGGNGFRVVNLFTEDHAALSGSRNVVIRESLKPERSWNASLNWNQFFLIKNHLLKLDVDIFYTYFTNKIVGDYITDNTQIIYENLKGFSISKGISSNIEYSFAIPIKIFAGITYMDVYQIEKNTLGQDEKQFALHAPKWSGVYTISWNTTKWNIDITGNWYGTMKLPLALNDYRPEYSPPYSIINLQIRYQLSKYFDIYIGGKNLLNFYPRYPLLRTWDPFERQVMSENEPAFDTAYNYAPVQGFRVYGGLKLIL